VALMTDFAMFRSQLTAKFKDSTYGKLQGGLLVEKTGWMVLLITLALVPATLAGQEKPIIVLHPFTAGTDVAWPYDMKLMQTQTIAEVKAKVGKQYEIIEVTPEAPASDHAHTYTLDGEILAWDNAAHQPRIIASKIKSVSCVRADRPSTSISRLGGNFPCSEQLCVDSCSAC